jgi:hypothetical protein
MGKISFLREDIECSLHVFFVSTISDIYTHNFKYNSLYGGRDSYITPCIKTDSRSLTISYAVSARNSLSGDEVVHSGLMKLLTFINSSRSDNYKQNTRLSVCPLFQVKI